MVVLRPPCLRLVWGSRPHEEEVLDWLVESDLDFELMDVNNLSSELFEQVPVEVSQDPLVCTCPISTSSSISTSSMLPPNSSVPQ